MVLGDSCNNQFFRLSVEAGLIFISELDLSFGDDCTKIVASSVGEANLASDFEVAD